MFYDRVFHVEQHIIVYANGVVGIKMFHVKQCGVKRCVEGVDKDFVFLSEL